MISGVVDREVSLFELHSHPFIFILKDVAVDRLDFSQRRLCAWVLRVTQSAPPISKSAVRLDRDFINQHESQTIGAMDQQKQT